jgi:hypothetical protein
MSFVMLSQIMDANEVERDHGQYEVYHAPVVSVVLKAPSITSNDSSVVCLSQGMMEELCIGSGAAVLLTAGDEGASKGAAKNSSTVVTAIGDDETLADTARVNDVVRNHVNQRYGDSIMTLFQVCKNLGVELEAVLTIAPLKDICACEEVYIMPFTGDDDVCRGLIDAKTMYVKFLMPYFAGANRPLCQGDVFVITQDNVALEFKAIGMFPCLYGLIVPDTDITIVSSYYPRVDYPLLAAVKADQLALSTSIAAMLQEMMTLVEQKNSLNVDLMASKADDPLLSKTLTHQGLCKALLVGYSFLTTVAMIFTLLYPAGTK